ncbi:MAG: hypothetical protein ABJN69_10010 [Hellea sp.]
MSIWGHFRGVRIRKGVAVFPYTGTEIPLNGTFFKGAIPVVRFNSFLMLQRLGRFLSARRSSASIAFYPQPSGPWYNAWLAARMGGLKILKNPEEADVVFVFDDTTESKTGALLEPAIKAKAINHRIDDISKTHVGKVFEQVFGYSVDIDPLTYQGWVVQKSDINATHDGQVVDCPLPPSSVRADSVYQKLIESDFTERGAEDLRMAYVGGEIPVVHRKFKTLEKRFGTDYAHVDVLTADQAFSKEEQEKLIEYCGAMGLDFGAVDVMRDKHDGRIYVVDVNKTGMPVLCLSQKSQRAVFRSIAEAFLRLVEARKT